MNRFVRRIFSPRAAVYTNTLVGGMLMGVGEAISQSFENYKTPEKKMFDYDFIRIRNMATIGALATVPNYYYYKRLDMIWTGKTTKSVVTKTAIDITINSPVNILWFLAAAAYTEGKSTYEIKEEMKEKFLRIFTVDCFFWIPVSFVNFKYVSSKYRLLFLNVVSLVYDSIVCTIKNE